MAITNAFLDPSTGPVLEDGLLQRAEVILSLVENAARFTP